ncbi:MAG TPA: hypothetical protein VGP72_21255 [Planctomycetota bacterium]|jgi:hypothetical protein
MATGAPPNCEDMEAFHALLVVSNKGQSSCIEGDAEDLKLLLAVQA